MAVKLDLTAFNIVHPSEDRWLAECFLPPRILSALLDPRSTLVSGGAGYGKSALAAVAQAKLAPNWLNVTLDPPLNQSATSQFEPLYQSVVQQMWQVIEHDPAVLSKVGSRARAIKYFLNRYLGTDLDYQLECLGDDHPEHATGIEQFRATALRELFTAVATDVQRLDTLCDSIQKLGVEGVMVWIDQPKQLDTTSAAAYVAYLRSLFDSVMLMRRRLIHFKCLALPDICQQLANVHGVVTKTVATLELDWNEDELLQIANRRLQIAAEDPNTSLDQFVRIDEFKDFLNEYSDPTNPTEWLTLARFVLEQAAAIDTTLLDHKAWSAARRNYCAERLKIRLDANGVFWRGMRVIKNLNKNKRAIYPLIKHLYEHPGFHKTYRLASALGMEVASLNTNIHRARQDYIEPGFDDESEAIYLVTDPGGEGYALHNTRRS